MADTKLLAVFTIPVNRKALTFSIYGSCDIYTEEGLPHPEFYDLSACQIIDKKEHPYTPIGRSWSGRKFDSNDMVNSFITRLIRNDTSCMELFLEAQLKSMVEVYMEDKNTALTYNGVKIPKYILGNPTYELFELQLVTSDFIYYMTSDEMLMLNLNDHSLVSDNCFAEIGYSDSIDNIRSGKETLIWGILPQE